jgi:hypothetical protein
MSKNRKHWLTVEKERAQVISTNVDLERVKELVELIPFSVVDWKIKFDKLSESGAVTAEDEYVINLLNPYLRAMVIINYLQEGLREEADNNYYFSHMAPNDVVFAAYNLRLAKTLLQDILESNEIYDVVAPLLVEDDSSGRGVWEYYDKEISKNKNFQDLLMIVREFYKAHGIEVYYKKDKLETHTEELSN